MSVYGQMRNTNNNNNNKNDNKYAHVYVDEPNMRHAAENIYLDFYFQAVKYKK